MKLISTLSTWPVLRWPWLFLAASALLLEVIALYFQYGMGLEPCVMCIYQRTAVFGIFLAAIPATLAPQNAVARTLSFSGWGVASIWGAKIANQHVDMQNPDNFMLLLSCDAFPNFPTWAAIHEWFPAIFEARGTCGDIDWSFLGLSMPNWMLIIFLTYSISFLILLTIRLVKHKII